MRACKTNIIVITVICIISFLACKRGPIQQGSQWVAINPTADTLLRSIDRLKANQPGMRPQLIRSIEALDSVAKADGRSQLKARVAYARGRFAINNDSSVEVVNKYMNQALLQCDSVRYPYDWARIVMMREFEGQNGYQVYDEAAKAAPIFLEYGDSLYYGIALQRMGFMLRQFGDKMSARIVDDRALEIFRQIGVEDAVYNMQFQKLMEVYMVPRKFNEGKALADTLLNSRWMEYYIEERSLVYLYEFYLTQDKSWLYKALSSSDQVNDIMGTRTMSTGELAKFYFNNGETDSARYYYDIFLRGVYSPQGEPEPTFRLARELMNNFGETARLDSLNTIIDNWKAFDTGRQMGVFAKNKMVEDVLTAIAPRRKSSVSLGWWIGSGAVFLIVVVILVMLIVRRRKKNELESELPLSSSSTEETRNKGYDSEEIEGKLRVNKIKSAMSELGTWKEAELQFDAISPNFELRLRAAFPGITNAEMRMAKMISLGLDTSEIAQLQFLTPESVKKGRQRLRQRLSLDSSINLQSFLLDFHKQ